MSGQRAFGRGVAQTMNAAARERLKNPPPKPVAGWLFAVVLAAASFVLKLRRLLKQRRK
ncbi:MULTISPECIES: hypothetical protein [Arthrobacter]|uniref:hypothetical protein n=1 Tax=Arthrobacter TaxID=1663 RepID=UPI0028F711F9|nr:hypothetical protein [Arthrobacter sp. lap29]